MTEVFRVARPVEVYVAGRDHLPVAFSRLRVGVASGPRLSWNPVNS